MTLKAGSYYVMELADDLVAAEVTRLTSISERNSGHERSEPHVGSYHPRTLAAEVKLRGALPLDECLRIALSLTRALAELHRHGLVHRDIKPSNIMVVVFPASGARRDKSEMLEARKCSV